MSSQRERDKARAARVRAEKKVKTLAAYGNQCACCGESNPVFLVVDHINNDGARHREEIGQGNRKIGSGSVMHWWLEKNGYPEGFQILCANCNLAKQTLGVCPHQVGMVYRYDKTLPMS